MSDYISILEPIAVAKSQLSVSHNTEDNYFLIKAAEAEYIIGSGHSIVRKAETIQINDYQAVLPDGFHSLRSLRLTQDGTQYPRYVRKSFYRADSDSPNSIEEQTDYTFDIEDGIIYFATTITATECELSYNGYNIDDDGFPKIHVTHEAAIANYLCWQYTLKDFDRYPENVRHTYERQWYFRCNKARINSKRPSPAEMAYVRLIWNSTIPCYRLIT